MEGFSFFGLAEGFLGLSCLLSLCKAGLVTQGSAPAGGQVILLEPAVTAAEIIVTSVKDLILAQLAGKGAVKERNLGRRLESDLVKALVVVAYDPGLTADKGMLETLTYHLVEAKQVLLDQTLAVRRVGDDYGALLYRLKVLEVTLLKLYGIQQACSLGVTLGCQDSLGILVITFDAELKFTLGGVIVVYLLKEVTVKILPFLKCKTAAEQTGCHVPGYECCLDGNCT